MRKEIEEKEEKDHQGWNGCFVQENLLRVLILRLFGALSLSIIYKKIAAVL